MTDRTDIPPKGGRDPVPAAKPAATPPRPARFDPATLGRGGRAGPKGPKGRPIPLPGKSRGR